MNDSDVQSYLKFMVDTAVLLGADDTEAETQMRDVSSLINLQNTALKQV